MLTIKNEGKNFYLSIMDVQYIIPKDFSKQIEVHLKTGTILIIHDVTVNKVDQLLKDTGLVELKNFWRLADENNLKKV